MLLRIAFVRLKAGDIFDILKEKSRVVGLFSDKFDLKNNGFSGSVKEF